MMQKLKLNSIELIVLWLFNMLLNSFNIEVLLRILLLFSTLVYTLIKIYLVIKYKKKALEQLEEEKK